MKIILTPNDQAVAIQAYLMDTFNIVTYIDEELLQDMQLDINPNYTADPSENTEDTTVVEVDREWAETRANELGISFRSDIKTSTLITRIEDEEARIAKEASQPEQVEEEEVTTDTPEDAEDLFSTPEVESTSKDSTEDGDDTNSLFG